MWVGEGVSLADSAKVVGPSYIGDRTVVRADATVGPFASVERDCLVDCGTTIERSTILPDTYLSSGILIRHALVDGSYLEDLRSGAIADLLPSGLAGSMPSSNRAARTTSESEAELFLRFGNVVSDSAQGSPEWREMQL